MNRTHASLFFSNNRRHSLDERTRSPPSDATPLPRRLEHWKSVLENRSAANRVQFTTTDQQSSFLRIIVVS